MKTKTFFYSSFMMLCLSMLVFSSCGSDDKDDNSLITDAELIGSWTIIDGYETNGDKTNTNSIGYIVTFHSDGTGSVSIASIKWSRSGNHFSYYYTSNPSTVFSGTFSYNNGILTMKGSGNGWSFEYKLRKSVNDSVTTLVGIWKCTSSITTFKGGTYTDVLKGETLTINSDGTFKSTTSHIGKSGTWLQKDNTLYVSSTDGGKITLEFLLSATTLEVKGSNDAGESFNCTFVKE